jgi:hypothetical protein
MAYEGPPLTEPIAATKYDMTTFYEDPADPKPPRRHRCEHRNSCSVLSIISK